MHYIWHSDQIKFEILGQLIYEIFGSIKFRNGIKNHLKIKEPNHHSDKNVGFENIRTF